MKFKNSDAVPNQLIKGLLKNQPQASSFKKIENIKPKIVNNRSSSNVRDQNRIIKK